MVAWRKFNQTWYSRFTMTRKKRTFLQHNEIVFVVSWWLLVGFFLKGTYVIKLFSRSTLYERFWNENLFWLKMGLSFFTSKKLWKYICSIHCCFSMVLKSSNKNSYKNLLMLVKTFIDKCIPEWHSMGIHDVVCHVTWDHN